MSGGKKERNLRTSDNMRTLFFLGSVAGLFCGARHFLNYLSEQRKIRRTATLSRRRMSRRDQRSSPRLVSGTSPHGVGR
jgi:hypothetical protein